MHLRKAYKLLAIIIYIHARTNKRRNGKSFIESLIYKTKFFFCHMGVGGGGDGGICSATKGETTCK